MNQDYYEFIRLTHEKQLKVAHQHRVLNLIKSDHPTLRKQVLLFLSDGLLSLGQRIRPAEFEVHVHGAQSTESTMEITAKGC